MYRVTLSLGRPTIDRERLLAEGRRLNDHLMKLGGGDVLVDPVKGTMQLVLSLDVEDALTAALAGTAQAHSAFEFAELAPPESVVSVEAEHVPDSASPGVAPEHVH